MSQVMKPADIARLRQAGQSAGVAGRDHGGVHRGRPGPGGEPVYPADLAGRRPARDDGGPRPFTGPGSEVLPRWSPDGQRAGVRGYRRRRPVADMRAAGHRRRGAAGRVLGRRARSPSWSGRRTAARWRSPPGTRTRASTAPTAKQRRDQDIPPRRITRLLYRFNGAGWTADRPSRVFVVAADGSARRARSRRGRSRRPGWRGRRTPRSLAFASGRHEDWDLDLAVDLWVVRGRRQREPETGHQRRSRPTRCRRGRRTGPAGLLTSTRPRWRTRGTGRSRSSTSPRARSRC